MNSHNYLMPGSNESVSKGKNRDLISSQNLSLVKANPGKLDFMFEAPKPKKTNDSLHNKRSTLPSAEKIVTFNKNRDPKWSLKSDGNSLTTDEEIFDSSKKPSLKKLDLSRNHKVSDKLIGEMINRTVISSVLDQPSLAQQHKDSLLKFGEKFLEPLEDKKRKADTDHFKELVETLTDGNLDQKTYRDTFKKAKRILSSSTVNLRLGNGGINSGIGESLDLNSVETQGQPDRPPSPISKNMFTAFETYANDTKLGSTDHFFPEIKGGRATSSKSKI